MVTKQLIEASALIEAYDAEYVVKHNLPPYWLEAPDGYGRETVRNAKAEVKKLLKALGRDAESILSRIMTQIGSDGVAFSAVAIGDAIREWTGKKGIAKVIEVLPANDFDDYTIGGPVIRGPKDFVVEMGKIGPHPYYAMNCFKAGFSSVGGITYNPGGMIFMSKEAYKWCAKKCEESVNGR